MDFLSGQNNEAQAAPPKSNAQPLVRRAMDESIFYRVFCQTDLVVEHVLCHLEARDLCVFVHMVMPASNRCAMSKRGRILLVETQNTACNDGVCFDRWFGGHTGLCQCRGPKDAWSVCVRAQTDGTQGRRFWHEHMAYNSLGQLSGPTRTARSARTTRSSLPPRHGRRAGRHRASRVADARHMPLTRCCTRDPCGRFDKSATWCQCVPFIGDTQYVGVLCGRHMVVLRRSVSPRCAARGTLDPL